MVNDASELTPDEYVSKLTREVRGLEKAEDLLTEAKKALVEADTWSWLITAVEKLQLSIHNEVKRHGKRLENAIRTLEECEP